MVKDTSADDDEVRFAHCDMGKFCVIIWSDAHRSWKFIIGNVLCCYKPAGAEIGPHLYYLETALRSWWIGKVWNHHFKIAWQSIRCSKNLIKPSRLLIMFYFDSISFLQWGSMVLTPCRVSNKPSLSLASSHKATQLKYFPIHGWHARHASPCFSVLMMWTIETNENVQRT